MYGDIFINISVLLSRFMGVHKKSFSEEAKNSSYELKIIYNKNRKKVQTNLLLFNIRDQKQKFLCFIPKIF